MCSPIAHQAEIGFFLRLEADAVGGGETFEGALGALLAEIARHRAGQFLHRHRGAPEPEARRHRRQIRRHENIGLQPFDRRGRAAQREADIANQIERQAPDHAVHQRRDFQPEQMLRAQHRQAPRPVGEDALADHADVGESRQQQRIGPDQDAGAHAGDGAVGGGAPPEQPAEKRRRQLRDGREGENADGEKLGVAGAAVIHIGEQQDDEDRQPPHREQQQADIAASRDQRLAPVQHQRHDDVVRHHDRQRHQFHDHHGGGRRQAADESHDGQHAGAGLQRQRQHEHVAVDLAGAKRQQAGKRDRHHEQIDRQQIERKQPGGALDLAFIVVLDHRHVELPRQQDDRHERQQRGGEQRVERRLPREDAGGLRAVPRRLEQRAGAAEHPEGHEDADREEGEQLDDRFGGDRQHQTVLVFGGVDMAGAEQHREGRHRQRDEQRNIAEQRLRGAGAGRDMRQDRFQRSRHGFELQRDIGNGADDGDQRDGCRHRLALAVTRGDEVGDRGGVLRLGQPHDADEQRREQADHQRRADIDGEEFVAGARGRADRAEEGPRGAIDRQRQRIDQQPAAAVAAEPALAVPVARHQEQQADIRKCRRDDDPALQHARSRKGANPQQAKDFTRSKSSQNGPEVHRQGCNGGRYFAA